jgi:hypothetical protein
MKRIIWISTIASLAGISWRAQICLNKALGGLPSYPGPSCDCGRRRLSPESDDAREKVEQWRKECKEYNEMRPYSAIGDRTPLSLIHLPRQPVEAPNRPEILT